MNKELELIIRNFAEEQKRATDAYNDYSKDHSYHNILHISKFKHLTTVINKPTKEVEKIIYFHKEVRAIAKSINISATKRSTTAVKGYGYYSDGFTLSGNSLVIRGKQKELFMNLVTLLQEKDLVDSFELPTYTIGQGLVGHIMLKKNKVATDLWNELTKDLPNFKL